MPEEYYSSNVLMNLNFYKFSEVKIICLISARSIDISDKNPESKVY